MITEIFGENCLRAKVFDLLLSHPHIDYTKSEIAQCANVSRGSLNKFIDQLLNYGIIIPTREIGNGQLYKINLDSPITQALNSFQNQLADIEMEKEMREYQKTDPEVVPIKPFEKIAENKLDPITDDFLKSMKFNTLNLALYTKIMNTIKDFSFKTENKGIAGFETGSTGIAGFETEITASTNLGVASFCEIGD
ncbi:hypothetical protein BRM9_1687 [Methanobacterium formicicum]|uniref:Uncharacterized protein n=1 Tax=Methanobacterium formicicum TaxID=2162 RepID=A0A089ZII6_METFO|nr:winged helix-turn-helix domain-containing protein [Methanobacterium formicicum]AIS32498.1 hypothetical protein BRM9_1687 [Methanobacterium formicicum]